MHAKLIMLYVGLFYILPTSLHYIVGQHPNFVDFSIGLNYLLWFVLVVAGGGLYLFSLGRAKLIGSGPLFDAFRYRYFWLCLSVASLPLAIYFKLKFGVTFRQEGDGLSEVGGLAKLVFLLKPILTAYAFYSFFVAPGGRLARLTDLCVLLFFVLSLAGSFEALLIFLLFAKVFLPETFDALLVERKHQSLVSSVGGLFFKVLVGVVAVACIVFIGIANKVGFSESIDYFTSNTLVSKLGAYLYYRIAVFNSTLAIRLEDVWDLDYLYRSYEVIADSFTYRASIIMGEPSVRPELTNLNRLNYVEVHRYPKVKEIGASPGLFASFIQLFPAPFAALVCGVYSGFFISLFRLIKPARSDVYTYSWVAALFSMYMMFPFLHNPVMNVTTIGPEFVKFFIYLYVFVVVASVCERGGSSRGCLHEQR